MACYKSYLILYQKLCQENLSFLLLQNHEQIKTFLVLGEKEKKTPVGKHIL